MGPSEGVADGRRVIGTLEEVADGIRVVVGISKGVVATCNLQI